MEYFHLDRNEKIRLDLLSTREREIERERGRERERERERGREREREKQRESDRERKRAKFGFRRVPSAKVICGQPISDDHVDGGGGVGERDGTALVLSPPGHRWIYIVEPTMGILQYRSSASYSYIFFFSRRLGKMHLRIRDVM